jgi:hypothetical protein
LLNFTKKINTNGEERKKKNCIRQIQADKWGAYVQLAILKDGSRHL